MLTFNGNALWYLTIQSSMLTKVVMITAVIALIACTFIFFYKWWDFYEKQRQVRRTVRLIKRAENIDDIIALGAQLKGTMGGAVIGQGLFMYKQLAKRSGVPLSEQDRQILYEHLMQVVTEISHEQEEYLPLLSLVASVSPLVGLFGTVSGLIQSFIAIQRLHAADITVIAPGIAEALLTTLAGLLVAIPALVIYYYLQTNVTAIDRQLEVIASRLLWVVQQKAIEERMEWNGKDVGEV